MGLFSLFSRPDINEGVAQFKQTPGAVLLDVRGEEERVGGFVPGSVSLPMARLAEVTALVPSAETPVFVYCHSGVRSSSAAKALANAGYVDVHDIGGIVDYKGKLAR